MSHRSVTRTLAAACVCAWAWCAAPPPAEASAPETSKPLLEDAEAQANLDAGLERFYAEDFEGAARFFAQAYAIEPTGFLLYSWAQAERYNNRCTRAIELFERFLATEPPAEESKKAREKILECGGVPPAQTAPAPRVPPPAQGPPSPTVSDTPGPSPAPTRTTRVAKPGMFAAGLALVTVGVGVGATGAVLAASGGRLQRDAPDAPDQQSFVEDRTRGEDRTRAGWALVGTGGALLVTGAVILVLRSTKLGRTTASQRARAPLWLGTYF